MRYQQRPLTHDEKKAAEAAFQGSPFNPQWSQAGQKVYWGLSAAIANNVQEFFEEMRSMPSTTFAKGDSKPISRFRVESSFR